MLLGTRIQLEARGPQDEDIYLKHTQSLKPFTCQHIARHTRFATELRDVPFPQNFTLGATNTVVIPRLGDLMGDIMLHITLPAVPGATVSDTWVDAIGYVLLRRVRCAIDDTVVHNHERLWYDLEDALFASANHVAGLDEMIGRNVTLSMTQEHTILVPLKCFFCKKYHPRQNFMPLLGIPDSTITLSIDAESCDALCTTATPGLVLPTALDVMPVVEYVHVEAPEKERLLRRPTRILYEDTQDVEALSYKLASDGSGGGRILLDTLTLDMHEINAPVKLLVWVSYLVTDAANKRYFQYRGDLARCQLLANAVDLVNERDSAYFTTVSKYFYVKTTDRPNVHVHSFALDATTWQPTGALNFDQIAMPQLKVQLAEKREDVVVKLFVMTYKHIIFFKGRAALQFI